jgi:hypothetical protein
VSIQPISPFPLGPQSGATGNLSIPGGDDFAGKLQLGQIIKGRVLRHYEGSRYGVDFNGREKVVDSGVPLQTGELLYGKVIGLGDKVELERVRMPAAAPAREDTAPNAHPWTMGGDAGKLAAQLFEQYQGRLTPDQAQVIEQSMRGAGDKQSMALSGLMLSKLGVNMAPELLKAVYELLRADPNRGLFALSGNTLELQTTGIKPDVARDAASQSPVVALAEALKQYVEQSPEKEMQDNLRAPGMAADQAASQQAESAPDQQNQSGAGFDLGRWLLNVQTGGSVGHRVNTIPLLVNGRLVELDIAVFEQREGRQNKEETKHRQLSFSLRSEQLGQVEAHLVLTGDHMKMTLGAERETTAESLSAYSPELMQQLKDDGWQVDQLNYEVKAGKGTSVARAVLQHVVSQDSVSRLV